MRAALLILFCCAVAVLAGQAVAPAQEPEKPPADPPAQPEPPPEQDDNPCIGPRARFLLCPDLVMRRPYALYVDRFTKPGRTLLRAGNVIDSIGKGPAELHGTRIGPRFMKGRQRIYRRNGTRLGIDTGARLEFKFAHLSRRWWKFHDAARFELWRVDAEGRRSRLVRTGPKVAYCLRDLRRTRPGVRNSPPGFVYPACSTNPSAERVTIGTSPGWADIYPPTYPEQWIDVTGLRGCFAYVHIADPENGIYEANEDNNEAQVIVKLPYDRLAPRGGCRGRDRGRGYGGTGPY